MSEQGADKKAFQPLDSVYKPISSKDNLSLPSDIYQAYDVFQRADERNDLYKLERPEEVLERDLMQFSEFLSLLGAHHASAIEQQLVSNTHIDPIIRAQLKRKLAELLEEIIRSHQPPPTKAEQRVLAAKLHQLGLPATICLDLP